MIDPIDAFVGERVRARRKMLGFSQTHVGKHLGVTFQQIQKYEKGTNRIGSGRLFRLADFFDVEVSYFFEGAEYTLHPDLKEVDLGQRMNRQETKELVYAYYSIADPRIRRKVIAIAKLLI
jgi:transcriptional regulator with XRE-family HTH domain